MPKEVEIEAAARVLCQLAYFQLPAIERMWSADAWPDVEIAQSGGSPGIPYKRWQTFSHEARLALEAAEHARMRSRHDMGNDGAQITAQRIRSLVEQTRQSSDDLVAAGVNRKRLEERLSQIENHLDQEHRDPIKLQFLLTELQADLIEVENKLIDTGVLPALHQILGTGVPAPR